MVPTVTAAALAALQALFAGVMKRYDAKDSDFAGCEAVLQRLLSSFPDCLDS